MSATLNCCNPCASVETVNVPGTEGDPGTDGTDGLNAYTQITSPITIPAEGVQIPIDVVSAAWMVVGQVVIIGEGIVPSDAPNGWANFQVISFNSATQVVVEFLNYDGDTPGGVGEVLAVGCNVSPAGLIGPAGP